MQCFIHLIQSEAVPEPNGLVMMTKFAQRLRAALSATTVGGLIGLLAAAAALGLAELVAGFTGIAGASMANSAAANCASS